MLKTWVVVVGFAFLGLCVLGLMVLVDGCTPAQSASAVKGGEVAVTIAKDVCKELGPSEPGWVQLLCNADKGPPQTVRMSRVAWLAFTTDGGALAPGK